MIVQIIREMLGVYESSNSVMFLGILFKGVVGCERMGSGGFLAGVFSWGSSVTFL
jgi:hypothetical protein